MDTEYSYIDDIDEASCLYLQEPLADCTGQPGRRVFVFASTSRLMELREAFRNANVYVSPGSYARARKRLSGRGDIDPVFKDFIIPNLIIRN